VLVPLLAVPPFTVATAALAGLGYALLPAAVELAAVAFYTTSGAVKGAALDVKRRRIPPASDEAVSAPSSRRDH